MFILIFKTTVFIEYNPPPHGSSPPDTEILIGIQYLHSQHAEIHFHHRIEGDPKEKSDHLFQLLFFPASKFESLTPQLDSRLALAPISPYRISFENLLSFLFC